MNLWKLSFFRNPYEKLRKKLNLHPPPQLKKLTFVVRKDMKLERPMSETATHWIAMGFHKDLNEAVKIALRDAMQFIVKAKGLTPDDAYALASIAVDLRVTQIVDGNKGIRAMIPKTIFKK